MTRRAPKKVATTILRSMRLTKKGEVFTLRRKTKPGVANVNGYTYNKDDFDAAIEKYIQTDGGLYLAPVTVDESSFGDKTEVINNSIYVKFHTPNPNKQYKFGKLIRWDDETMTFGYCPSAECEPYLNMVTDNVRVCTRYLADTYQDKQVGIREILLLDLAVIPFDMIGIDIYQYAKEAILNGQSRC